MEWELRKAHRGWRMSAWVRLVVECCDEHGTKRVRADAAPRLIIGWWAPAGVEDVKADISSNKLTVTGKVNPSKIKERLEEKTGKKVEIISPQPKNDAAAPAGDKKPDEKKPAEEKKEEDKKPKQVINHRATNPPAMRDTSGLIFQTD